MAPRPSPSSRAARWRAAGWWRTGPASRLVSYSKIAIWPRPPIYVRSLRGFWWVIWGWVRRRWALSFRVARPPNRCAGWCGPRDRSAIIPGWWRVITRRRRVIARLRRIIARLRRIVARLVIAGRRRLRGGRDSADRAHGASNQGSGRGTPAAAGQTADRGAGSRAQKGTADRALTRIIRIGAG